MGARLGLLAALFGAGVLGALLWPTTPRQAMDRPLPAGAPPTRIVAFGTSLTAGNAWPDGLAAQLSACLDRPVQVIRVARNGMGVQWALTQIEAVRAARPDLVLVEFVINDADVLDGVSLAKSRAGHERLLADLRAALPEAEVMLMTTPPVSGLLRRLQRPRLAAYDGMLRDLAAAEEVALADLAPRWHAARRADPALRAPDGLHPDDNGTAVVTVPALAALIGGRQACGEG